MIARSLYACLYAYSALCFVHTAQAATTYTFVINQELSEVVRSNGSSETFQISGSFDLAVDTSSDTYWYPSARLSPRSIAVDPLADPDFRFPSYFLRSYTEVDSVTANFFGTGNFCDEFNARRDRGGTCWSFGRSSFVSGMLDGTTLHLEGTNTEAVPVGSSGFDFIDTYDYSIYATLATPMLGDFDLDFDVDGNDFLLWQHTTSSGNLTDWQTNYGAVPAAGMAGIETVPEPTTLLLLAIGLALLSDRHQPAKF